MPSQYKPFFVFSYFEKIFRYLMLVLTSICKNDKIRKTPNKEIVMKIDVRDFGAIGDAKTLNTVAIQNAIDECFRLGGGQVVFEDGTYLTGKIVMRSNIELHVKSNATILASPRVEDFPDASDEEASHVNTSRLTRWRNNCIIFANECKNIAITGTGTINGNAPAFLRESPEDELLTYRQIDAPTPARAVFFTGCENIKIKDIAMIDPPAGWSYWIHDCDFVTFSGCKVVSNLHYPNCDGIHINCSRNVNISDCNLCCGDDCIIVRANSASLKENKVCEKVTVTNCNLTSYASGIRVGWVNDGTIRNCTFSNIVMTDTSYAISIAIPSLKIKKGDFLAADVGREYTCIERLSFNNIIMDKISKFPVEIKIGEGDQTVDGIRNLYFSGIHAKALNMPQILGRKENPIENIYFSDCSFEVYDGSDIPDLETHGYGAVKADEVREIPSVKMLNTKNIVFSHTTFGS